MDDLEVLQKYYDEYRKQEGEHPPLVIGEIGEDGCSDVQFLDFPTHRLFDNQISDILKILIIGAKRRQEYINR